MNRLAFGVLILCLVLGACTPSLSPVSGPNAQSTSNALVSTFGAQTMAAQPTLTLPPPADTATAPIAAVVLNTSTPTASATITGSATATKTVTVTGTLSSPTTTVTGTISSPTNTVTGTLPSPTNTVTGTPPTITPTDDMIPRSYGTQPPYIDYGRIELKNLAKTQVYISFQCTTPEGYYVVVEYPVGGSYIKVSVPAGRCAYVAWVGGVEFTGEFGLKRFEELTITFKRQSVTIQ